MASLILSLPNDHVSEARAASPFGIASGSLSIEQSRATPCQSLHRNTVAATLSQFHVAHPSCHADAELRGGSLDGQCGSHGSHGGHGGRRAGRHGHSESDCSHQHSAVAVAAPAAPVSPHSRFSHIDLRLEMWNLATATRSPTSSSSSGASRTQHHHHQNRADGAALGTIGALGAQPSGGPARSRSSPMIAPDLPLSPAESPLKKAPSWETRRGSASRTFGGCSLPASSTIARSTISSCNNNTYSDVDGARLATIEAGGEASQTETLNELTSGGHGHSAPGRGRRLSRWQSVPSQSLADAARCSTAHGSLAGEHHCDTWPSHRPLGAAVIFEVVNEPATTCDSAPATDATQKPYHLSRLDRKSTQTEMGVSVRALSRCPLSAVDRGVKLSTTGNVFEWAAQQRIARHRSALQ